MSVAFSVTKTIKWVEWPVVSARWAGSIAGLSVHKPLRHRIRQSQKIERHQCDAHRSSSLSDLSLSHEKMDVPEQAPRRNHPKLPQRPRVRDSHAPKQLQQTRCRNRTLPSTKQGRCLKLDSFAPSSKDQESGESVPLAKILEAAEFESDFTGHSIAKSLKSL